VKYVINKLGILKITSQHYTTIGNDKAVRIETNESASFGNKTEIAFYFMMHGKKPYAIGYVADPKNYVKYLPEFEQIVKSLRFVDSPLNEIENLSDNKNITNTRSNFSSANLTYYKGISNITDPQDLYIECVGVAGKSLCDSLFRK
jgi:hypothetical protein